MSHQLLAPKDIPDTEYSVYVYHYPNDIEDGHTDWEMVLACDCVQAAINQAQSLHDSDNFKKIEVKKKHFHPRYNRIVDETYKVFQNKKRPSRRSSVMALLGLSCFAGFGLLAFPFFGSF